MNKTIALICLICVVLTGFSMPVIEREDFNLSIDFSGISSVYYDFDADLDTRDVEMAFAIKDCFFGINGMYKDIEYVFKSSFQNNSLWVKDLYVNYHFSENLKVKLGYFRVPFGRVGYSKESDLLMYNRNPLYEAYSPERKIGIAPELEIMDGKLNISAGLYNGDDFENVNDNTSFDGSGVVHYMPLGKFDYSESAREGFDNVKLDISPGFSVENDDIYSDYFEEVLETKVYLGSNIALRYKTAALDMAYYSRYYTLNIIGFDYHQMDGFSVQFAYAIKGKLEPSIRYSSSTKCLFLTYDGEISDAYNYDTRTTECGISWYLNNNSRFGLYYVYSDYAFDYEDIIITGDFSYFFNDRNEIRLFYALEI